MLISEASISEALQHIWLVTAEEAGRKILQKLGLAAYFKNNIFVNSDYTGSSVSWKDKITHYAYLNDQKCHINVKFNNNTTNLKWDTTSVQQHMDTMVNRRDSIMTHPLFLDPETGIHIIYREVPCNVQAEVQLVFNDSTIAFDTVAAMTNTFNRGELMEPIDLSYDYQMPVSILRDLYILGKMKGLESGTFVEWFDKCSDGSIQWVESKRLNNKHHEVIVRRHVYNALMGIDYNPDQPAIESKGTAAEGVVVPFNFTLQFSRVNMMYLKYPIVVNNNQVPASLIHLADDELNKNLIKTLTHPECRSIGWMYEHMKNLKRYTPHMPWYDNWFIPRGGQLDQNDSFPMLIAVFTFDEDTSTTEKNYTTIDIYSMDGFQLTDTFKAWLLENKDKALNADSKYSITAYDGNVQLEPSSLLFDGRYLKIPNTFKHEGVFRIVFARTKESCGPYPWLWILDCFIVVDNESKEDN